MWHTVWVTGNRPGGKIYKHKLIGKMVYNVTSDQTHET